MKSSRPFSRSRDNLFRPALSYLSNNFASPSKKSTSRISTRERRNSASSLDDTDHSDVEQYAAMETSSSARDPQSELHAPIMPLIDIGGSSSRASSPYPRSRSAVQSEDEDDDFEPASSIRPLVSSDVGSGRRMRGIWRQGGLGGFFFGTWMGWQIWVALLVFWVGGCSFGLLLMNRFILLTGVYKFPYPIFGTYLQLILTHILLIAFSSLTRALGGPLRKLGLGGAVAPSYSAAPAGGAYRNTTKPPSGFSRWLSTGSGGIAGGGLFEFDIKIAKQVLLLSVVFTAKLLLSNFAFAYVPLTVYQLSRIGITPLALILSSIMQKDAHSTATLSSALIATLNLLFASIRHHNRVTWENILVGVFSSLFVALYPILLLRTYHIIVAGLVPQGDVLAAFPTSSSADDAGCGNREETRAYYRVLHYTSLLSLLMMTPVVLLSGDLPKILRNIPFLDVPFFWLMIGCGALGSFAVFVSTLLLVKTTSPLTATFIAVPRGAFQLVMLSLFKMPAHSWVGVALCWVSSLWFLAARREEGRRGERLRLEGR